MDKEIILCNLPDHVTDKNSRNTPQAQSYDPTPSPRPMSQYFY
jgi:hypothetical protein